MPPIDPGPRPELTWLPIDRLDIDESYQRSLGTPRGKRQVRKIAEGFRWAKFQAILAAPEPGVSDRWLIIDGQHRVAAARQVGLPLVPAVVIHGIGREEQAAAFVGANRDRVAVSAQALFHARVAAGDPEALAVKRLCDKAGILIVRHNQAASQVPAGQTAAVPALLRLVKEHGEERAGEAVAAVAECFGRFHGALRSPFFLAAGRFLAERGTPAEIRRALTAVGWQRLERVGVGLGGYTMIPTMVAELRKAANVLPELRRASEGSAPPKPATPTAAPHASAPTPSAAPLKAGSLPAAIRKPASPTSEAHRASDRDEIARFMAAKGSRVVMSPEQVAQLLRDAGYRVVVAERTEGGGSSKIPLKLVRQPVLDGKPVTLLELYDAANELRRKAGMPAIGLPQDAARAG